VGERPTPVRESPITVALCPPLIIAAAFAAYHNSFSGPFVFDDIAAIVDKASGVNPLWSPPWPTR